MTRLTRTELKWIINELNKAAAVNLNAIKSYPSMSTIERGTLNLNAENLTSLSTKLQAVLAAKERHIAIG